MSCVCGLNEQHSFTSGDCRSNIPSKLRQFHEAAIESLIKMNACIPVSPVGSRILRTRLQNVLFTSLFLVVFFLTSCSSVQTQKKQFVEVDRDVSGQNFIGAAASIEKSKEAYYEKKDRVLYYLDLGMLYHYAGSYTQSSQALTSAEDGIDELYTKSISKGAESLLLNDNARMASGRFSQR